MEEKKKKEEDKEKQRKARAKASKKAKRLSGKLYPVSMMWYLQNTNTLLWPFRFPD